MVGKHSRRRSVATHAIAMVLTAACTTAMLGACGPAKPTSARIPLLPNTAAKGNAWTWTSACRFAPHTRTGCEASGPNLGPAQLAGNEWNLGRGPAGTGSVSMAASSSGTLNMKGDLSRAPPCTDATCITSQANTWVRGYPSVLYGINQCNATTSPPQSHELRLPMRVRSIPSDLVGSTAYDAQASQVTHDVAYDMWLSASDTQTPCQTDGTLEVMVWTGYDVRSVPPVGLKVGTASVPFAVNGTANPGDQAWSVYANNVFEKGHTQPWGGTVWLVLDAAHAVSKGTVTVDLSSALDTVATLLQNNYGWSDVAGNYWLDTIAFGMEFGPQDADPYGDGPTDFSLNLSSYCLVMRATVSAAAC